MTVTAIRTNISGVRRSAADFTTWPTKRQAAVALASLRARGLNLESCVRIDPALSRFSRLWVIARPDDLGEMTWLMRADGSWIRGRLYDGYESATWVHTPAAGCPVIPPTFTHVTRTVQCYDQPERYRTKSNGSCGRWVRGDDSVALCTCGWSSHESTREGARGNARMHRAQAA